MKFFWKKQLQMVFLLLGVVSFAFVVQANGRLQVVASWSILEDVVQNVGGEQVQVQVLAPRGSDLHSYKMTPSDQVELREADLVVWLGGELEIWLASSLDQIAKDKQLRVASHLENLLPIAGEEDSHAEHEEEGDHDEHAQHEEEEHEEHAEHDDHHGHSEHHEDLHVWHSVPMMIEVSKVIAKALAAQDPTRASDYEENVSRYIEKLQQLDTQIRQELSFLQEPQRILVTDHRAFEYFGRAYDFQTWSVQGYDHHDKPSAKRLESLVKRLEENKVKVVFSEEEGSRSLLQQIAKAAKIQTEGELLADNLAPVGKPGSTYESFMQTNVKNIAQSFQKALGN